MEAIRFGTDGWRGIIAEDFTFTNVRRAAQAVARYLLRRRSSPTHRPKAIVGYDTRFLSDRFASACAGVLSSNGVRTVLSDRPIPSPCLSYSVVSENADLGIMITASHNPPYFSGFKIKAGSGAPADHTITEGIEKYLGRAGPEQGGSVKNKDLTLSYLKKIKTLVDMRALKKAGLKIIYDPMYGTGMRVLPVLFGGVESGLFCIHSVPDPFFGGLNPEPIEKNLFDLKKEVIKRRADVGIATDGDADRIGVVDDTGRYLSPNQVFPLLLCYLVEGKGLKGGVVQTISMGYLGERIANFYGLPFREVPVGFKYVAGIMETEDVLMGGEESGGYGYRGYIPERDGTLSGLLFLEMIAGKKKKLSLILEDLEARFGKSFYDRVDIKISRDLSAGGAELKDRMTRAIIKKMPAEIAGFRVREVKTFDGVKFILGSSGITGGEAWLLLRTSGTEPLVRVYAEADAPGKVKRLLDEGKKLVSGLIFSLSGPRYR